MAEHRHKRETNARRPRAVVIAGPIALLTTASAVALGVSLGDPETRQIVSANQAADITQVTPTVTPTAEPSPRARQPLSRSGSRFQIKPLTPVERAVQPAAVRRAIKQADTKLWTTAVLNLWASPAENAANLGELDEGERVLVTGRRLAGREEIVLGGKARWVTEGYLSEEKPFALGGECTNGTSVPSGVSPNITKVHAAVCAAFPEITSYGTFRSDGEHSQGLAIDIMVSGDRGWQVAEFVRENYRELGVSYVIYSQQIWSVERAGEGWRGMEDRGSATANHYDHVHVTTY